MLSELITHGNSRMTSYILKKLIEVKNYSVGILELLANTIL